MFNESSVTLHSIRVYAVPKYIPSIDQGVVGVVYGISIN